MNIKARIGRFLRSCLEAERAHRLATEPKWEGVKIRHLFPWEAEAAGEWGRPVFRVRAWRLVARSCARVRAFLRGNIARLPHQPPTGPTGPAVPPRQE